MADAPEGDGNDSGFSEGSETSSEAGNGHGDQGGGGAAAGNGDADAGFEEGSDDGNHDNGGNGGGSQGGGTFGAAGAPPGQTDTSTAALSETAPPTAGAKTMESSGSTQTSQTQAKPNSKQTSTGGVASQWQTPKTATDRLAGQITGTDQGLKHPGEFLQTVQEMRSGHQTATATRTQERNPTRTATATGLPAPTRTATATEQRFGQGSATSYTTHESVPRSGGVDLLLPLKVLDAKGNQSEVVFARINPNQNRIDVKTGAGERFQFYPKLLTRSELACIEKAVFSSTRSGLQFSLEDGCEVTDGVLPGHDGAAKIAETLRSADLELASLVFGVDHCNREKETGLTKSSVASYANPLLEDERLLSEAALGTNEQAAEIYRKYRSIRPWPRFEMNPNLAVRADVNGKLKLNSKEVLIIYVRGIYTQWGGSQGFDDNDECCIEHRAFLDDFSSNYSEYVAASPVLQRLSEYALVVGLLLASTQQGLASKQQRLECYRKVRSTIAFSPFSSQLVQSTVECLKLKEFGLSQEPDPFSLAQKALAIGNEYASLSKVDRALELAMLALKHLQTLQGAAASKLRAEAFYGVGCSFRVISRRPNSTMTQKMKQDAIETLGHVSKEISWEAVCIDYEHRAWQLALLNAIDSGHLSVLARIGWQLGLAAQIASSATACKAPHDPNAVMHEESESYKGAQHPLFLLLERNGVNAAANQFLANGLSGHMFELAEVDDLAGQHAVLKELAAHVSDDEASLVLIETAAALYHAEAIALFNSIKYGKMANNPPGYDSPAYVERSGSSAAATNSSAGRSAALARALSAAAAAVVCHGKADVIAKAISSNRRAQIEWVLQTASAILSEICCQLVEDRNIGDLRAAVSGIVETWKQLAPIAQEPTKVPDEQTRCQLEDLLAVEHCVRQTAVQFGIQGYRANTSADISRIHALLGNEALSRDWKRVNEVERLPLALPPIKLIDVLVAQACMTAMLGKLPVAPPAVSIRN